MVEILRGICQQRKINLTAFSDDWLFCLELRGKLRYVFGYDFGLNNATAKMICKDKAATSDLLCFHRIPRIEHRIFHGPQLAGYVSQSGNWQSMLDFLAAYPGGVVCKPNEGTGGNSVHMVKTPGQLEGAVYSIFSKNRSLCLSPFEDFEHEYRVAMLDGSVQFAYRKHRPTVVGNGKRTIRQLLLNACATGDETSGSVASLKPLSEMQIDGNCVPHANEIVRINWRHNLGQGAKPELITADDPSWQEITDLAKQATAALDVRLASIDIAATQSGAKVLEINSGIMMESLYQSHQDGPNIARDFYDRIICSLFDLPFQP